MSVLFLLGWFSSTSGVGLPWSASSVRRGSSIFSTTLESGAFNDERDLQVLNLFCEQKSLQGFLLLIFQVNE